MLAKQAEPGTRVMLAPHPKYAAPSRAYKPGRGVVVERTFVDGLERYVVRLDDGEVITLSGVHLKREDLGYGKRARA